MDPLAWPAVNGAGRTGPSGSEAVKKNQEKKILGDNKIRASCFDFAMRLVGRLLFETVYGLVLIVEGFKDRDQFGDHHQVLDLVGQVLDLDRAAFFL
jgi:hypothetical protein